MGTEIPKTKTEESCLTFIHLSIFKYKSTNILSQKSALSYTPRLPLQ